MFSYVVFVVTRSSSNTSRVRVPTSKFGKSLEEGRKITQRLNDYSQHCVYDLTEYNQNDVQLRVLSVYLKGNVDDDAGDTSKLVVYMPWWPWDENPYNHSSFGQETYEITQGEEQVALCIDKVQDWLGISSLKSNTLMWQYLIFRTEDDYVSMAGLATFRIVIVKNNIRTRSDEFHLDDLPITLVVQDSTQLDVKFNNIQFYTPGTMIAYTIYKEQKAVIALNNNRWSNIYPEVYARIQIDISTDAMDNIYSPNE